VNETLSERIAYRKYWAMERIALSLPEPAGRGLLSAVGWLTFRTMPGVRATVAANLARVLGLPPHSELVRAATREAFSLYARYWYDTFRARTMSPGEVKERFRIEGLDNVDRALERGTGAILALPHMGNWDMAGRFMVLSGYRLVSVAEDLRPKRLADLFLRHREALGIEILVLSSAARTGARLARLLSEGSLVALVADRDLTGRGVEVEMFGAPRKLPAGPALLSLSTGAPLMTAPVYTRGNGWLCQISEPIEIERTGVTRDDVTALTRRLAAEFERAIAASPVDWYMFQPAWEDSASPPPEGPASRAAGAASPS
jgi:KDO2-lipid IV(A) lauroyltransferase